MTLTSVGRRQVWTTSSNNVSLLLKVQTPQSKGLEGGQGWEEQGRLMEEVAVRLTPS